MQSRQVVYRRRSSSTGIVAGIFGCIFGTLGILTIGLIFVPLGALCAFFGLLRGIIGGNVAGIGISLIAWITVALGTAASPTVWVAFLGILGAVVGAPHH